MSRTDQARNIEIREWSETPSIELSPDDQRFLREDVNRTEKRIGIEYRPSGDAILHATQHVGVVSLPSGVTLQIEPKAAGGNLLHLLRYGNDIETESIQERTRLAEGLAFLDVLGELFLAELRRVVERGLSRSYERTQRREQFLRGRLLLEKQVRTRGPIATDFACEFDEFTADTTLNRAVLAATVVVSQLVQSDELVDELQAYRTLLRRHVTERIVSPNELEHIHLTRLNSHYKHLLRLVRLVLEGTFIEDLEIGSRDSYAILIDMNRVFERVVERAFRDAVETRPGWTIRTQRSSSSLLQGHPPVELIPDLVVRHNEETELVLDAKWKRRRSNSDLYQLVAYELAEQAPGALIYPELNGTIQTTYDVRGGYRLDLVEFDTGSYAPNFEEFEKQVLESAQSVLHALVHDFE